MLAQRLRRCSNIEPTLGECLVLLGWHYMVFSGIDQRYAGSYSRQYVITLHCSLNSAVQKQTAITAYLKSKQLLLLALARQYSDFSPNDNV